MAFKGIFNKGETVENNKNSLIEFEKQVRRINTLEVHLNRLLKLEARLGPLLLLKEQLDAAQSISAPPENNSIDTYTQKELRRQNQEIEKLKLQVTRLELVKKQNQRQETSSDRNRNGEDNLRATYQNQAGNLQTKIESLEVNLIMVNRLQVDILKQLEVAREHWNELQKRVSVLSAFPEQPSVPKEIYIDKLFLEKYEQNNTIAQVGIRELSGVLNIGATYGTVPLPGGITPSSPQDEDKEPASAPFKGSEHSSMGKANSDIPESEEEIYSEIPIEEAPES